MTGVAELKAMGRPQLLQVLQEGHSIDPHQLEGFSYLGTSLGLPGWVDRLAWKTFLKCFHRDPDTGRLRGWNVRLEQGDPEGEPTPLRRGSGAPLSFGHFEVVEQGSCFPDPGRQAGLLIHYGLGGNRLLDPICLLRDPIVSVSPDDPTLLLGRSYLQLGARISTPSFFTLERLAPVTDPVAPPR